jgi:hypothetical protein
MAAGGGVLSSALLIKDPEMPAAWSSIAGSLLTRFGWVHAGRASARDHRIPLELPENAAEVRKSSHQIALQKPA